MATILRAPDIQRPRSAGAIVAATAQAFVASLALLLAPAPVSSPGQSAQPERAPGPAFSQSLRNFTLAPSPCLAGQDTFFAGPGCGPDYDWPNPVLRLAPHAALSALPQQASPALFTPPQSPFAQTDWPNPVLRAAPRAESESGVWNNRLANLLAGADQFFASGGPNYDWPNPVRRVSSLAALGAQPNGQTLDTGVLAVPAQITFDWPNPVLRRSHAAALHAQPLGQSALLGNFAGQDVFFTSPGSGPNYDWPNPVRRVSSLAALVSQPLGQPTTDDLTAIYTRPIFADFPNISGNSFRNVLPALAGASLGQIRVTFVAASAAGLSVNNASIAVVGTATAPNTQSVPTELLFGGVSGFTIGAGESITSDWTTFSCLSSDTLCAILDFSSAAGIGIQYGFGVGGANLYYKGPAPNPVVSYNASTVSGFSLTINDNLVSLIETRSSSFAAPPPVPAYDWPNPVLRRSHTAALHAQPPPASPLLFPPPSKPFAQTDWPNPVLRAAPRAESESGVWNNRLANLLAGADQFFTAAGRGPNYDWPNPVLRRSHAAALAAQFDARGDLLLTTLRSQDRFFRGAGDGQNYDWPRPILRIDRRAALVAQPLGYNVSFHFNIAPFAQRAWPNPVRRIVRRDNFCPGSPPPLLGIRAVSLSGVIASASGFSGVLTVSRLLVGTSSSVSALGARRDGSNPPLNAFSAAFFIG